MDDAVKHETIRVVDQMRNELAIFASLSTDQGALAIATYALQKLAKLASILSPITED